MIVTIHQPEHLPWLGFFAKAAAADTLVLLDHVQFRKNYFQNRNRVRTKDGFAWLTVPVRTKGLGLPPINEVRIANDADPRWREKHWRTLRQSYGATGHFDEHEAFFRDHYDHPWSLLVDANVALIEYLLDAMGVDARVLRSSELACQASERTKTLLEICEGLEADAYLSGVSGRDYLEESLFAQAGIDVAFQDFRHPVYRQRYEPFIPCMSAVDLLFNHGPRSADLLRGIGTETLDVVFN